MVIGGLTPLVTNLSQWANTGDWPGRINWVVILAGCGVGAATQLLSFLSQSFGDWKAAQTNGNGKKNENKNTINGPTGH